jgi:hypothetical protein
MSFQHRIVLFLISGGVAYTATQPFGPATVTINVFDTFGHAETGCKVLNFVEAEHAAELGMEPQAKWEHASRFDGSVGRNVPAGLYYANVTCGPQDCRSNASVEVRAPETSLMIACGHLKEDYHTGSKPRLTVAYHAAGGAPPRWAKLVGVYLDRSETARLDQRTGKAEFYGIVPGRYLLILVQEAQTVCVKEIDFLESPAEVSVGPGCRVEATTKARVVPEAP